MREGLWFLVHRWRVGIVTPPALGLAPMPTQGKYWTRWGAQREANRMNEFALSPIMRFAPYKIRLAKEP